MLCTRIHITIKIALNQGNRMTQYLLIIITTSTQHTNPPRPSVSSVNLYAVGALAPPGLVSVPGPAETGRSGSSGWVCVSGAACCTSTGLTGLTGLTALTGLTGLPSTARAAVPASAAGPTAAPSTGPSTTTSGILASPPAAIGTCATG